jgi:hypothetical protein
MRLPSLVPVVALLLALAAVVVSTSPIGATSALIYADTLAAGWTNASWGSQVDLNSGQNAHSGGAAIAYAASSGWGALSLNSRNGLDTSAHTSIRFYMHGGSAGGQKFGVSLAANGAWGPRVPLNKYIAGGSIAAGEWRLVDIPLSVLGAEQGVVNRIAIQSTMDTAQPTVYVDGIEFHSDGMTVLARPVPLPILTSEQVALKVDAGVELGGISPLIYGVGASGGAEGWFKEMGVSLVRWGGNARTRHNWEINASSAGSDWEFRNLNQAGNSSEAGKASVDFVTKNRAVGAESMLTIPTIGWVSKDGSNKTQSTKVPAQGGAAVSPGSEAIEGYDPSENRGLTSVASYARKNVPFAYPPDPNDGAVYQDEWVSYLKGKLGSAEAGGVRLYAMDNEPDLWADSTHVDVHPVRAGYDEVLSRFLEYAEAVKGVDPSAQVTGPVGWGWLSLWYSALDRGSDNFASHADRKAHGNVPFYQWFLGKVREHDESAGYRTLDVLDLHYYPQGGLYSKAVDAESQARRLRATRSLWDPGYAEESWIAKTEGGPAVRLIPRLREWIEAGYPGTKIGITEWNFGADHHINGALAIADVLGIFGREGVYLANYWTYPAKESPGYFAFRMYRNYDGNYSRFGDVSVMAESGDAEKVSVYASKDSGTGELKVMLVNKMPQARAVVSLDIGNYEVGGAAQVYQYSGSDLGRIRKMPDLAGVGGKLEYALDPYSITLLVLQP